MELLRKSTAMMDADYRAQHDIVQRYIRRQMPADELAAFEVVLIAHPELSDEIEAQRVLNYRQREPMTGAGTSPRGLFGRIAPHSRGGLPLAVALLVALAVGLSFSG